MKPRSVAPNSRAAVFAAVCTLLAVAAHRLMSDSGIPVIAIGFGAVAVFCFARIAAALGERGLATIGLLVGGSQIGLHLLFQAAQASSVPGGLSAHGDPGGPIGMTSMPGMPGMGNMPGMTGMAGAASGSLPGTSFLGTTTGMTVAHVLAALVTAWWLRRGEAALFAVVRCAGAAGALLGASWRMVAAWAAGWRPLGSAGPERFVVGVDCQRPLTARVLLFTVIRRGPPAAAVR